MAIPDFQTLMAPTLREFEDGDARRIADVRARLALEFRLTDDELEQRLPSGAARRFANRCGWATSYLSHVGLLERSGRGVYRITERGRAVLAAHPNRIDLGVLAQFPEFDKFRTARGGQQSDDDLTVTIAETFSTPAERIEEAYTEITRTLRADLKRSVATQSPQSFEDLVLDVLSAMGYGGSRLDAAKRLGHSGDGGIDGVIREDRLGLDQIYVQAKRWESGVVGRPAVQAFVGALQGVRATRGVMIATSTFSRGAREYAEGVSPRVVLVDGDELADLMIEHEVGVAVERNYAVKRVDSDYFADDA